MRPPDPRPAKQDRKRHAHHPFLAPNPNAYCHSRALRLTLFFQHVSLVTRLPACHTRCRFNRFFSNRLLFAFRLVHSNPPPPKIHQGDRPSTRRYGNRLQQLGAAPSRRAHEMALNTGVQQSQEGTSPDPDLQRHQTTDALLLFTRTTCSCFYFLLPGIVINASRHATCQHPAALQLTPGHHGCRLSNPATLITNYY